MKSKYIILFLFAFCPLITVQAQSVASSCTAADSLVARYDFDATKLAIRHLHNIEHADTASIVVAPFHKEKIQEALLAIHQAYSLPARDEVVEFFNIHALGAPVTNSFTLYVDTSYSWTKDWMASEIYTGGTDIDQWVDSFELVFSRSPQMVYVETLGGDFLKVNLQTDNNLNLSPLMNSLLSIDGVEATEEEHYVGEIEKDIRYSIDTLGDFADLTYSYGWGNCTNGCLQQHFWTFRVFFSDCTVQFVSDSGDPLQTGDITQISQVAVYPNPTNGLVSMNLVGPAKADFFLRLYDAYGQLIRSESLDFYNGLVNLEIDLSSLPNGVYFITLHHENQVLTERVVKK